MTISQKIKNEMKEILRVKALGFSLFLALVVFWSNLTNAETTVHKKDGRFQAVIETGRYNHNYVFLDKVVLEVQWWTLMGEPVHLYKFKWQRGANFELPSGATREDIAMYPDLLRRFDAMKPLDIHLEIDFELSNPANDCGPSLISNSMIDNISRSLRGTKMVRSTPHLLIGKAGKLQSGLSPGSYRWQEFATRWLGDNEHSGAAVKQAFKCAQTLTLYEMKVVKLTLPEREIKSIDTAYLRREKQASKEENKCDMWSGEDCDKAQEDKEVKSTKKECDVWSGEDCDEKQGTQAAKITEKACDVWAGEDCDRVKKAQITKNTEKECDIWAGECETARKSPGECDLWAGDCGATQQNVNCDFLAGECDAIIKEKEGKRGVVSKSTGQVLIPFRDWAILSFKHGVAKVSVSIPYKGKRLPFCEKEGKAYDKFYSRVDLSEEGMVDFNGEWLIPPKKIIDASFYRNRGLYLTTGEPTDEAKRRQQRREQRFYANCKARLKRELSLIVESYKSQGFINKSKF